MTCIHFPLQSRLLKNTSRLSCCLLTAEVIRAIQRYRQGLPTRTTVGLSFPTLAKKISLKTDKKIFLGAENDPQQQKHARQNKTNKKKKMASQIIS